MTLNFKKFFSSLFVIALLLSTFGCWAPSKESAKRNGSSFYVKDAKGEYLPADPGLDLSRTVWKTIDAQNYKFRVCLSDHYADQPVRESTFKVIAEDGGIYPTVTDSQGCLEWTERFPFNFFANQSVYVLLERKIRPDGVGNDKAGHKGEVSIQFAVNPWQPYRDPGVPSVIFLSGNKSVVPKGQLVTGRDQVRAALEGNSDQLGYLWMHDLKLIDSKMAAGASGYDIQLQVEMTPRVILKNLTGESRQIQIPSGRFKLQSYLLVDKYAVDQKPLILNPQSPAVTGAILKEDGVLRFKVFTRVERKVAEGNLLMALKVIPIDGPSIRSFQSLHLLGEMVDLRSSKSPTLQEEIWGENRPAFSFDNYISPENTANFADLEKARLATKLQPIEFEIAQVRFLKIAPGETSTTRTVVYRATTCLIDNVSLRRLSQGQKFAISFEGSEYSTVEETDSSGCLRLIGTATHKYYDPQRTILQTFKIRKVDSCQGDYKDVNSKCFEGALTVGINPWDDKFTFGVDVRELSEKYLKESETAHAIPSKFVIDRYGYNTLGFRYEVDEFLNMKVIKRIYLRVEPMVLLHHSNTRGRNHAEPLRDGLYLLKVAMHRDYLDTTSKNVHISNRVIDVKDPVSGNTLKVTKSIVEANPDQRPRTFVSVVKKVVRVQHGVIVTPVELRLRDLRLMSVRANLLVQIEPLDEQMLQKAIVVERNLNGMSPQEMEEIRLMLTESEQQRKEDAELGVEYSFDEKTEEQDKLRQDLKSETLNKFSNLFARLQTARSQSPDPLFGPLDMNWLLKTKTISQEEIERIERNDFSESKLVSSFDYDIFVDKKSGLERRTFVGPIRLLENVSQNSMVPTDDMSELFCDGGDCNQLEKLESNKGRSEISNYENIRYFGSLQHLQGMHVDDLIQEKIGLETNYYREQYLGSLVSSFVDTFNLRFVSLKDEQALEFQDKCDIQPKIEMNRYENWDTWQARVQKEFGSCLVKNDKLQQSLASFLDGLNRNNGWFGDRKKVDAKDLDTLIRTGKVSVILGERLCEYWKEFVLKPEVEAGPAQHRGRANQALDIFESTCKASVGNPDGSKRQLAFMLDKKVRVKKVGAHQYKGGKSVNINVVSQFQLARVEGANIHGTVGFDPLGVPVVRDIISSPAKGGINLNYNIARNRTDSTNIMEQTFLVMQTAALAIELDEYEQCMVVKVNPRIREAFAELNVYFRPDLKGENETLRQRHLAKGLYLCTGKIEKTKIPILERYFYMTQHFTEGDMLDTGEFYNRPWLLSLRGARDMRTFLKMLREQDKSISLDRITSKLGQGEADFFSINQLSKAYMQVLPSFPGVYTMLEDPEEKLDGLDYPSTSDPYKAFDRNLDRLGVGVKDIERYSPVMPAQ
jgi:hypothetical protein